MSTILKFDFQKRKQLCFSEVDYLNYTKRPNFACDNCIFPKTMGNKNKQCTHSTPLKVEASWFKCFIVFLENLVLGTFICADNESKIKKIGWRLRFWDTEVAKTTDFLSKSHDLPHKVIREVRQININVLQKATNASFIFLIFTYVEVYLKYFKITK